MLTPDTIVPDPANPQSFNRYSYVENNPVGFKDPSGHDRCGAAGAVCVDEPPLPSQSSSPPPSSTPLVVNIADEYVDWYYSPNYGGCFRCHATFGTDQSILTNEQLALVEYQMEKAAAEGAAAAAVAIPIAYAGVKLVPLLCGGDCGDEAANILNRISPNRSPYPNTAVPRSFTLSTSNGSYYVTESATKHMQEYVSTHPNASQAILGSFDRAVTAATSQGSGMIYNQPITINGWELIFAEGTGGPFPVIYHALYYGSGGG